jgi:hypothetical protein
VLRAALATATFKLVVASRTCGTNDVHLVAEFAPGHRDSGFTGMYGRNSCTVERDRPRVEGDHEQADMGASRSAATSSRLERQTE